MELKEMMENHRKEQLKAIYKFICHASIEELSSIISEICVCYDNIVVFNIENKSLDKIDSVSINNECIQLTTHRKK